MAQRYYTILVVPEHAAQGRQYRVPMWLIRSSFVILPMIFLILFTLFLNYRFVANQVFENRELEAENRRLRQNVQVYKSRMDALESSYERVENLATRLKLITHLVDQEETAKLLELPPPYANQIQEKNQTFVQDKESLIFEDQYRLMSEKSFELEQNLNDLFELLTDQRSFLLALPTLTPARGSFTSGFGIRFSPLGDGEKMHEGIDIAGPIGTPIIAPANARVVFAGPKPGYGQIVILDHGYGLETWFGHTSRILVKSGQGVRRGQAIAQIGNSGRSTGPHLHYEVRAHGIPVDPLNYILEN